MFDKRNWKIYYEWIDGKDYKILAEEFHLSEQTIKEICLSKVPPTIQKIPWQRMNQYAKWRSFAKAHPKKPETIDKSTE